MDLVEKRKRPMDFPKVEGTSMVQHFDAQGWGGFSKTYAKWIFSF